MAGVRAGADLRISEPGEKLAVQRQLETHPKPRLDEAAAKRLGLAKRHQSSAKTLAAAFWLDGEPAEVKRVAVGRPEKRPMSSSPANAPAPPPSKSLRSTIPALSFSADDGGVVTAPWAEKAARISAAARGASPGESGRKSIMALGLQEKYNSSTRS